MEEKDNEGNLSYHKFHVNLKFNSSFYSILEKISSRSNFYSLKLGFKNDLFNVSLSIHEPINYEYIDKIISSLIKIRDSIRK